MSQSAGIIQSWSAWAPGLPTRAHWQEWLPHGGPLEELEARPACKQVGAMQRRRFTANTRMMATTALEACELAEVNPGDVDLVYGSANGEISPLKNLLGDLCQNQPLSPTHFSNCVHHTPTGHFGMAAKQRHVSRTLSSYKDTFICLYLEAAGLLLRKGRPVLLAIADEALCEPFDSMLEPPPFPYGAAMVLKPGDQGIRITRIEGEATSNPHEEPVFGFLNWLENGTEPLKQQTSFGVFQWSKT